MKCYNKSIIKQPVIGGAIYKVCESLIKPCKENTCNLLKGLRCSRHILIKYNYIFIYVCSDRTFRNSTYTYIPRLSIFLKIFLKLFKKILEILKLCLSFYKICRFKIYLYYSYSYFSISLR